jgi:archaellin
MKIKLFTPILILLMALTTGAVFAQVTAGPSDVTTAPPATTAGADKILCSGSTITLTGPQDAGGVDYTKYHWYKIDPSGNKQEATTTGRTYTETSGAAGYYNYQVVTENATGCTSPISDVFKIFVLPPLTVSITTPSSTMCALPTNSSLLTANVTPATGYTFNYQWTRNGVAIPGATSSTYDVTGESTAGTVTFGVNVSYTINPTCPASATKDLILTPIPGKPLITAN